MTLAVLYYYETLVDATIDISSWQPLNFDVFSEGGRKMEPEQTLDTLRDMKCIFDCIKRERSEYWTTTIKELAKETNDLIRLSYIVPRNCRESYFKMFNLIKRGRNSENLEKYLDCYYDKQVELCKQQGWEFSDNI